jgi:short-subunit dehydrogenase
MKKAIVIGASSGIGKELAITLAKNGYEVGLMARRTELLEALKNEIPTKTHVGYIDLSKVPEASEKVSNMIQTMQRVQFESNLS